MNDNFQHPCEGFAVEMADGLIFTVKGLIHPHDRLIAYLRYLPDQAGDRNRDGIAYRRIYRFEEQQRILKRDFPCYLGKDPCFGIPVQWVETRRVRRVYDPRKRLEEISRFGPQDRTERKVAAFAELLLNSAGIDLPSFGISGSVLLNLHLPKSDLDFIVYGEQQSLAVHGALDRLLDKGAEDSVRRLNSKEMSTLHDAHRPDTPLSFENFASLQDRKVNEGLFQGSPYFIRFVKHPSQFDQKYNDPRYKPLGNVTIRAKIINDRDAIFTPCTYQIDDVKFIRGKPVADLWEIASFRGRFTDQVRTGELASARGNLERVIPCVGPAYHRLTVGGTIGDYLMRENMEVLQGSET
jgi:hypothetical protein